MTDASQKVEVIFEDDHCAVVVHPDHDNATIMIRNPGHDADDYRKAVRKVLDLGYIYLDDEFYDSDADALVMVLVRES